MNHILYNSINILIYNFFPGNITDKECHIKFDLHPIRQVHEFPLDMWVTKFLSQKVGD